MKFLCETCNYLTDRKSNFDTHNTSKRHLTKCNSAIADAKPPENHLHMHPETTPAAEEIPDMFPCKYCDQKFVFKQSMYRHIKNTCKKKEDHIKTIRLMKIEMEKLNTELQNQNQRLDAHQDKINKLLRLKYPFDAHDPVSVGQLKNEVLEQIKHVFNR